MLAEKTQVMEKMSVLPNYEACATLPAQDLERAKRFYEKIGFKPIREYPDTVLYKTGHSYFMLYKTQFAGTAQNTLLSWSVDNLDDVIADLKDKGVVFEEYSLPGLKTVNGIATAGGMRTAWFRDSEGNILAITEAKL
jgi:catechol 2,3-dioxygenase-like lactoylglutathione lyase family enzyme